jgi:protein-tyrosine phosphatase
MVVNTSATEIVAGLWQGALDVANPSTADFEVVISMTSRAPHPSWAHQQVHHFPVTDPMWAHEMSAKFHERIDLAADVATQGVRSGRRVLVLCAQGKNRSGLVVAMALHKLKGWSGEQAMRCIQQKRPGSLYNIHLQRFLEALPPASWRMLNA